MDKADVDAMLQEMASSLPIAQNIESSGEEMENNREGDVTVFNRSNHLMSLGMHDSFLPYDTNKKDKGEELCKSEAVDGMDDDRCIETRDAVITSRSDGIVHRTKTDMHVTQANLNDTEWDQFKTGFMEQLQSSNHEVRDNAGDHSVKQHLLMKAFSELQPISDRGGPTASQHHGTTDTQQCMHITPDRAPNGSIQSSGDTTGPVPFLSTSALSGIEMSALDRALEEIETSSMKDERSIEQHPLPKLAWGESSSTNVPDLMSQLATISSNFQSQELEIPKQRRQVKGSEATNVVTETSQQENGRKEDGKKTVYVDLRPSYNHPSREKMHNKQSTSESEESDDQVSWALKRRHIKSALSPPQHSIHSAQELGDRILHGSHSAELHQEQSSKEQKTSEREDCATPTNFLSHTESINVEVQECASVTQEEHCINVNFPIALSHLILQSTASSNLHSSSSCDATVTEIQQQTAHRGRYHSTESFTVSSELSSFSEGELSPTKPLRPVEGTDSVIETGNSDASKDDEVKKMGSKKSRKKRKGRGGKGGQADVSDSTQVAGDISSPETVRAELVAKQEEGKKKKKKGDKKKEGNNQSRKKSNNVAKKASILRIRLDSLTTSSDEERVIDSPHLSSVVEVVEPLPVKDERKAGGESKERLRQRLEHKILSKKPPSTFETPATEPLFHKDVSFSPVLSHVYSSVTTDNLLVLSLSSTHGLISLPPSHPHISPEAHVTLHSLLLTYLAVSAASCSALSAASAKQVSVAKHKISSSLHKLPLRVTALYQTILDGQLSILIGASLPQGRKRSVSYPSLVNRNTKKMSGAVLSPLDAPRNPSAIELAEILHRLKLRDLLGSLIEDREDEDTEQTAASDLKQVAIPSDILNEIQPVLDMSIQAFFSVHPDTDPLTTPISFYWHSLYQPSCLPTPEALCTAQTLQSTVCAIPSDSLANPSLVFHAIRGAYDFGLTIAGVRMVYGESCLALDMPALSGNDDAVSDFSSVLVLCLRGPDAVSQCMDLVGPEDYNLAKVTDPCSIMARYGGPQYQPMQCTRTPFRVSAALSKWFGGRACLSTGSVLGMTDPWTRSERRKRQRVRFSESEFESEDNLPTPTPDVSFPPLVANRPLLTVLLYEQVLLVVSPLLQPLCYSSILATCGQLGFDISGVKRVRLNSKRAAMLDIPPAFISHFTPSSTSPSPNFTSFAGHPLDTDPPLSIPPIPSLLLIVCGENALVQSCALKTAIIANLKSLLPINPQLKDHVTVTLDYPMGALLQVIPYNSENLKMLGSFAATTVTSVLSLPQLAPEWEQEGARFEEEISFLAITQSTGLARAVDVLRLIFDLNTLTDGGLGHQQMTHEQHTENTSERQSLGGFELIGIKLIPQLSRFHAKQLCPIPSSDHAYQEAIELLSDSPALILVVRGIACNRRLKKLFVPTPPRFSSRQSLSTLSLLTSDSLSQAFRCTTMFFTDKELFCDPISWPLLSAVPSAWARTDVLCDYQRPPLLLYSVLVVKGGEWRLLVKVVDRLCRVGFEVCGVTMRREESEESPGSTRDSVCSEVAVCVARQNAVWYLNHELKPFLSSTYKQNILHSPTTFSDAVVLVKQFFPKGVCGPDSAVATHYGVNARLIDDFCGLTSNVSTPPTSPITENTCIILPPSSLAAPSDHPTPHYLQLLELVVQAGFSVTGIQMTHLSQSSTTSLRALGVDNKELECGPCLILQLQRDNAASCFHHILKSAAQRSGRGISAGYDVDRLLSGAIVPDSPKMATAIVAALVGK